MFELVHANTFAEPSASKPWPRNCNSNGGRALAVTVDVTRPEQVQALVDINEILFRPTA